VLRRGQA